MPADAILNTPIAQKRIKIAINGIKGDSDREFVDFKKYGAIDGFKSLNNYSYLADNATYEAYNLYVNSMCGVPFDQRELQKSVCEFESECAGKDNINCEYYKNLKSKIIEDIEYYKGELFSLKK